MIFKQTGRKRNVRTVVTMGHFLKTACLFLCVVGILIVTLFRSEGVRFSGERKQIRITAHRGASYGAPENTEAAVLLAIEEGADYVEIDVRMTADGIPVLLHDRALFRTTGIINYIDHVTYAELATYDAGGRYGEKYAGETVPDLKGILEAYGKKTSFNIELKNGDDIRLVDAVVALIELYGLEERCVVTSASYVQLEQVKRVNARIKTGYILSLVYGEIYGYDAADFFSVRSGYVTESMIKQAHKQGKEVHAWTVNKAHELKKMKEMGVDNVITDRPAYARNVLEETMQH
ncbi:MAG: hypothetical protein J6J38_11110 [Lachnospiraceae bacterium]|nr:hypothetical protein [Lachnospiraceae bacterium]